MVWISLYTSDVYINIMDLKPMILNPHIILIYYININNNTVSYINTVIV